MAGPHLVLRVRGDGAEGAARVLLHCGMVHERHAAQRSECSVPYELRLNMRRCGGLSSDESPSELVERTFCDCFLGAIFRLRTLLASSSSSFVVVVVVVVLPLPFPSIPIPIPIIVVLRRLLHESPATDLILGVLREVSEGTSALLEQLDVHRLAHAAFEERSESALLEHWSLHSRVQR